MDQDRTTRDMGRVVLIGGLLLILLIGLVWAFNPSQEGGITFSTGGSSAAEEGPAEGGPAPPPAEEAGPGGTVADEQDPVPQPTPTPTPEPTPEPTETGPPAEELIAAAPEPAETSVQVLDAGGGADAARAAADALEELGYRVVNVTSARAVLDATTVWFNEGADDAARALQAREQRVVALEENQALSTSVDLHLLVGSDWSDR